MGADEGRSTRVRKAWWRRKRWWVVAGVWVVVANVASLGPVAYCEGRGWLPEWVAGVMRVPAALVIWLPGVGEEIGRYRERCLARGLEDDGWEVEVDAGGITAGKDLEAEILQNKIEREEVERRR